MIHPGAGFIVYGVHKDGLKDPMGTPFIDKAIIRDSKRALTKAGLKIVEHDTVIATKDEARSAFKKMKSDDAIDVVILFSGTWVWAAHLVAAIRDFVASGKAVLIWTHPGSQGWRPVGGLVMHGGLLEVGVPHKFVYGEASDHETMLNITSYARAAHLKNYLNMSTMGAFGGRGMGQTCGVADPSQCMRMFGIDIDSRDTTELIRAAEAVSAREIAALQPRLKRLFGKEPEKNLVNEHSVRLYLALKKLVKKEKFDFYTIQSFPGLGDNYSATCFAQSMMLEGKLGPAGFSEHGIPTEGEAGGLSVKLVCKVGEGVLARLGRVNGEFQMVITRATIFEPPKNQLEQRLHECGIPFWPHGFVTVHCDIDRMLDSWTNEYACLAYGTELYPALIDFCKLTGIKPVLP